MHTPISVSPTCRHGLPVYCYDSTCLHLHATTYTRVLCTRPFHGFVVYYLGWTGFVLFLHRACLVPPACLNPFTFCPLAAIVCVHGFFTIWFCYFRACWWWGSCTAFPLPIYQHCTFSPLHTLPPVHWFTTTFVCTLPPHRRCTPRLFTVAVLLCTGILVRHHRPLCILLPFCSMRSASATFYIPLLAFTFSLLPPFHTTTAYHPLQPRFGSVALSACAPFFRRNNLHYRSPPFMGRLLPVATARTHLIHAQCGLPPPFAMRITPPRTTACHRFAVLRSPGYPRFPLLNALTTHCTLLHAALLFAHHTTYGWLDSRLPDNRHLTPRRRAAPRFTF